LTGRFGPRIIRGMATVVAVIALAALFVPDKNYHGQGCGGGL
jgi:hypothetical protein